MNVDTSPIKRYQFDTLWELDADINKIILGLKGVLTLNIWRLWNSFSYEIFYMHNWSKHHIEFAFHYLKLHDLTN